MAEDKQLTEQESLALITQMIHKAKNSYHDTGVGPLLWGTVVAIASFTSYLQREYDFYIGFDIWLIVLAAIIPQVIISIKTKKQVKKYEDTAIDAVWLVFGVSIFAVNFYQAVLPGATNELMKQEGWELVKHYTNNSKPDEVIAPFVPSGYSLLILLYAMPTMITGIAKRFTPMIIGAVITYVLFIISCYTISRIDWLLGGFAALVCWFIPGIILRRKFLAQRKANV